MEELLIPKASESKEVKVESKSNSLIFKASFILNSYPKANSVPNHL